MLRRLVIPAIALLASPSPARGDDTPVPGPLRCLDAWYAGGRGLDKHGSPMWHLPDGSRLPWSTRAPRSFEAVLAAPTLSDMFAIPYPRGPIAPVTVVDQDPGRVRVEPLFVATYPKSGLVPFVFFGQRVTLHERVLPSLKRVVARLESARKADSRIAPFLEKIGGGFATRAIAGTDRTSAHAWGIALDLNVARSHYWRWQKPPAPLRWQNRYPTAIVDAFEAEGWVWGGRWYHYDTMHFEYRPELLDARCALGSAP